MAKRKDLSDPRNRGRRGSAQDMPELSGDMAQQEYYEEAPGGISPRTKKRAGRFLWISIIFLIISILCIAGFMMMYNSSVVNAKRSCWVEQQNIEALAEKYVVDNGFLSLPAYVEDIPGFENVFIDCPSGGTYTWNPITGQYSCSEHGHWPEGFNQAQSINQGTTTVMIEAQ